MAKRKVRMLVSMAGPDESYAAGEEHEFDEPLAAALCLLPAEMPRAEPVGWDPHGKPKKPAETATREQREAAAKTPATR